MSRRWNLGTQRLFKAVWRFGPSPLTEESRYVRILPAFNQSRHGNSELAWTLNTDNTGLGGHWDRKEGR